MRGVVIEHLIENALVAAIGDDREHTVGALVEFIGRDIARKGLKCPIQKRAVKLALGLFSPASTPF